MFSIPVRPSEEIKVKPSQLSEASAQMFEEQQLEESFTIHLGKPQPHQGVSTALGSQHGPLLVLISKRPPIYVLQVRS